MNLSETWRYGAFKCTIHLIKCFMLEGFKFLAHDVIVFFLKANEEF